MADQLETYVLSEYRGERAPIAEIEQLADRVVGVFEASFDHDDGSWPYQIVTGNPLVGRTEEEEPRPYTFSTTAMIAYALSLVTGAVTSSSLAPAVTRYRPSDPKREKQRRDRVADLVKRAMSRLQEESEHLAVELPSSGHLPTPEQTPVTRSPTFGWDDPFTLNWLIEVLDAAKPSEQQTFRDTLCDRAAARVRSVLQAPSGPFAHVLDVDQDENVEHAFPLLRILQLRETLIRVKGEEAFSAAGGLGDFAAARDFLFQRVHRHLSESRIPDGNFDAAELVFALEGYILTLQGIEPDVAVIDQAFRVLQESQERNRYWRPLRPFKATAQGLVLLPQSVEIANSLLRICAAGSLRHRRYFSENVALLESYRRWLFGRLVNGAFLVRGKRKHFSGWESEYSHRLDRVHLWQTSQVLIFLWHYAAMLHEHIAQHLLDLARFAPTHVRPSDGSDEDWKKWKESEPFTAGVGRYRVYERIEQDFVRPRLEGKLDQASYSMLLYGPPGTGKTSIAGELSRRLNYRFLTVTPSDFITSGGEAVEARTKAIFTALEEQTELVVLFDEIDHLLLDRSSPLYREQGDLFKLLTPGMLTKLDDLAQRRNIIFIIATNYYERIDAAIKRPGRIEARYLVLPPDAAQRRRHLSGLEELRDRWSELADEGQALVNETARFTYSELTEVARRAVRHEPHSPGGDLSAALVAAAREAPPMAAADRYEPRLLDEKERQAGAGATVAGAMEKPWEEYAILAYLDLQVGNLSDEVRQHLREAPLERAVADEDIRRELGKAVEDA